MIFRMPLSFCLRALVVVAVSACPFMGDGDLIAEEKWSVEVGPEYVIIDGVMDHGANAFLENDETERWTPRLSLGYRLSDRWTLIAGFSELRDLEVSGAAGCSAPWLLPGEGCRQVVTPLRFNSDLQQFDIGLDCVLWRSRNVEFSAGVSGTLSVVSNSEFAFVDRVFGGFPTYQDRLNERFVHDETQWDLSGQLGFSCKLAGNWFASTRYRLTQPPGRTLHHLGLGIGVRF